MRARGLACLQTRISHQERVRRTCVYDASFITEEADQKRHGVGRVRAVAAIEVEHGRCEIVSVFDLCTELVSMGTTLQRTSSTKACSAQSRRGLQASSRKGRKGGKEWSYLAVVVRLSSSVPL